MSNHKRSRSTRKVTDIRDFERNLHYLETLVQNLANKKSEYYAVDSTEHRNRVLATKSTEWQNSRENKKSEAQGLKPYLNIDMIKISLKSTSVKTTIQSVELITLFYERDNPPSNILLNIKTFFQANFRLISYFVSD